MKPEPEHLTEHVADTLVTRADQSKQTIIDLEARYRDAAKYLNEQTAGISESWTNWIKESKTYLDEVRTWKFALELEVKRGIELSTQLRNYTSSEGFKEALTTLREFVEITERLKALSDSGFLKRVEPLTKHETQDSQCRF